MNIEILILIILFLASLLLLFLNFRFSMYVLLFLSVLLHKELFSIYMWDVLPVRVFMAAVGVYGLIRAMMWFVINLRFDPSKVKNSILGNLKDPFITLMILVWISRGISLLFSANIKASLSLFGFLTTVLILGYLLYQNLKNNPREILNLIKTYVFIVLGLSMLGFLQYFIYVETGRIYGALWNIPNHLPRLGSLFWDVNHFGGLIAALLPVLGVLIVISNGVKRKVVYLVSFLPMLIVLVMTSSRSAWISAFVSFLVFVTLFLIKRIGFKGIVLILTTLFLLSIPVVREYSIKSSPFRAQIKQYLNYRIDSFDSHFLLIQGAFEIFAKYPVFGGGYGSFYEQFSKTPVSATYFARDPAAINTRVPAHTIWGESLAETGIVGISVFIVFLAVLLLPILAAFQNGKSYKEYFLPVAMLSSLIGWLVAGIFYSYNAEFFWIVFFLYFIYGISTVGSNFSYSSVIEKLTRNKKFQLSILFVIASFLIFFSLGKNHFIPWDEAIYAKISKNMVESHNYLSMNWLPGKVWYEKPPLYMWLASFVMSVAGFGELAARLPSAILGLLTVLLVYLIGTRLFNKTAGFISALSILTNIHFLYYSRASMLDVSVTFFITLSLYFYLKYLEKERWMFIILSGISFGLGVMTKGVVGFIPLEIILFFEIYRYLSKQQKISRRRIIHGVLFLVSGGLIFMPWHLVMYQKFGFPFIKNYLLYHVIDRATNAIEDKGRPFFWYLTVMKVSMRIWFIALIGSSGYTLFRVLRKFSKHVFLLIWFLAIFLLFSISKSKLIWYIIPIYPVAALIVGDFIDIAITYFIGKFKFVKSEYALKALILYCLLIFSLFYLFLNREKVYTSDLTGSQAKLLIIKNRLYPAQKVFLDRIELPLALYYSNGSFDIVEYGPLKEKISDAGYNTNILFITKESRFRNFLEINPNIQLVEQIKEWALGYMPSVSELDSKDLQQTRTSISDVEGIIVLSVTKGVKPDPDTYTQLSKLRNQEIYLIEKISQHIPEGKN